MTRKQILIRLAAEFQFASCVASGDRKASDYNSIVRGVIPFRRIAAQLNVAQLEREIENWIQYHPEYIGMNSIPQLMEAAGFGSVVVEGAC